MFSLFRYIYILFGNLKKESELKLLDLLWKKNVNVLRTDLLRFFFSSKHIGAKEILCFLYCQNLFRPFKLDKIWLFRKYEAKEDYLSTNWKKKNTQIKKKT